MEQESVGEILSRGLDKHDFLGEDARDTLKFYMKERPDLSLDIIELVEARGIIESDSSDYQYKGWLLDKRGRINNDWTRRRERGDTDVAFLYDLIHS